MNESTSVFDFCAGNREYEADGAILSAVGLKPTADGDGGGLIGLVNLCGSGDFDRAVVSWNCDTPRGTSCEAEISVRSGGKWSKYFTCGRFSPYIRRASTVDGDDIADFKKEELMVRCGSADAWRVRLTLRSDGTASPALRLCAVSTRLGEADGGLCALDERDIETPRISQLMRSPNMARVICSTASVTMCLRRMGEDILPEETSLFNYDHVSRGNGNWSFSAAICGALGYESYVCYTDLEGLYSEIASGHPAVARLRGYSSVFGIGADNGWPYVRQAPGSCGAHLIVVRGFTRMDGRDYIIVNDPYAMTARDVMRVYRADEFLAAWSGVIYKIHEKKTLSRSGLCRCRATLHPECGAYALICCGERKALPPHFIGSQNDPRGAVVIEAARSEGDCDPFGRTFFADTNENGLIDIDKAALRFCLPKTKEYSVHIITDLGDSFEAALTL